MADRQATGVGVALWAMLSCVPMRAQTTQSAPGGNVRVLGDVVALDALTRRVSLKSDKGEAVTVVLTEQTALRKVPPGASDLTKAVMITFSDVGVGDRVLAIGQPAGGRNQFEARTVVVMSRADLTQKQNREVADWRKRGISGTVEAIDADAGSFTVRSGARTLTVRPTSNTEFRRYAPDSVRFSDARVSSVAEIKAGDLARVLGDRNGDGSEMRAEWVVSGTFRQIAATINSINAGAGEIVVKDLASKKTLTLRVNSDSTLKKLAPAMAESLARRYRSGAAAGGGPDAGQILERLSALPLSELKAGDALMVSLTTGSSADRGLAVMLLAGVEPLLTASPTATRDIMGGWNLGAAGETP